MISELPTTAALYDRYVTFSKQFFGKSLPPVTDVTIEWSTRMTSAAGCCYPSSKTIRLSTHYHRKFPEEIDATLLHEMIHLLVPNHGPEFYAWMNRIRKLGGEVNRYSQERATPTRHRWQYSCVTCGAVRRTVRRLAHGGKHHRCRRCKTGVKEQRLSN